MSVDSSKDQRTSGPVADDQRSLPLRLVALTHSFICGLFFWAIYFFFDRTRRGQIFDTAANLGPYHTSVPIFEIERFPYTWSSRLGHFAGSWWLLIPVGMLVALGAWRKRPRLTVALLATGSLSMVLATVLKARLPSRSMRSGDGVMWFVSNSLPSGRTTSAMAIGLAGIALAGRRADVFAVAGAVSATAVGIAAVVARWHNPSDIIAAYFLVGCLYFAAIAVTSGDGTAFSLSVFDRRVAAASLIIAALAVVVGALVIMRIDPAGLLVTLQDGRPLYQRMPVVSKNIALTWMFLEFAFCQLVTSAFFVVSGGRTQNRRGTPDLPLPLRA